MFTNRLSNNTIIRYILWDLLNRLIRANALKSILTIELDP